MQTPCNVPECNNPVDGDISTKYCYNCEILGIGQSHEILTDEDGENQYAKLIKLLLKGAN